jgi:hypothetical protein
LTELATCHCEPTFQRVEPRREKQKGTRTNATFKKVPNKLDKGRKKSNDENNKKERNTAVAAADNKNTVS